MAEDPNSPPSFFARHAADYRVNPSHARGADLEMLLRELRPAPTDRVLDVGTGTGHTALALAPHVREVIGIDATPEMLEQAQGMAGERGVMNVRFELGDATEIAYGLAQFDVVTTRRAAHHFPFPELFVRESHRVLRPGGRLGIVDMCPAPGSEVLLNQLERIRDPTHRRALTDPEWRAAVTDGGFRVTSLEVQEERYSLETWLRPVARGGPEERDVRKALSDAPESSREALGVRMGLQGVEELTKRRIILVATRA